MAKKPIQNFPEFVEYEFEIVMKKPFKAKFPSNMDIYDFEQIIINKLGLNNYTKDLNLLKVNDKLCQVERKHSKTFRNLMEKREKLKIDLDSLADLIFEKDYTSKSIKDKNESVEELINYQPIKMIPNALVTKQRLKRGNLIQTTTVTINEENYNMVEYNYVDFRNLGFDPSHIISFKEVTHPSIIRPLMKTFDFNTSEEKLRTFQSKYIYPDLGKYEVSLESLIKGDELLDHTKWHIIYNLCSIMDHYHKQNISHLNLTPFNIIMTDYDRTNIKLIDFGISEHWDLKNKDESEMRECIEKNSRYFPPELRKSELRFQTSIQPSYDMWSIGCIIYFMFTKTHPWDKFQTHEEIEKRISENDILIAIEETELDENTQFLITKCCHYNHQERISCELICKFILMNSQTLCPDLIEKIKEKLPKPDESLAVSYSSPTNTEEYTRSQMDLQQVPEVLFKKTFNNSMFTHMKLSGDEKIFDLDFSSQCLGNNMVNILGRVFEYFSQVRKIDLSSNALNHEGIEGIVSLYTNFRTKLYKFILSKNDFNEIGFDTLATAFKNGKSYIKELHLAECSKNIGVIEPILKILPNLESLEFVDLSGNFITDSQFLIITEKLPSFKSMKSLILRNNLITSKGIEYLKKNISDYRQQENLFSLDLSMNHLKSEGIADIANIFSKIKKINFLGLESNFAQNEGIIKFFEKIQKFTETSTHCPVIKELNLSSNKFDEVGLKKIISFFEFLKNKKKENGIEKLIIEYNDTPLELLRKLKDITEKINVVSKKKSTKPGKVEFDLIRNKLEKSLKSKCPIVSIRDFQILEEITLSKKLKTKKITLTNNKQIESKFLNSILFKELQSAESYYRGLKHEKEEEIKTCEIQKTKREIKINFYPKAKIGDNFVYTDSILEEQKSELSPRKTFKEYNFESGSLPSYPGELHVLLVIADKEFHFEILNNLKHYFVREAIINFSIIFYGYIQDLNKIKFRKSYPKNVRFYVITPENEDSKLYLKYLSIDLETCHPYGCVINRRERIAYIDDYLYYKMLIECIEELKVSLEDHIIPKNFKNRRKIRSKKREEEVYDQVQIKDMKRRIYDYQNFLENRKIDYFYNFKLIEKRKRKFDINLSLSPPETAKLRLIINANQSDFDLISNFFRNQIEPIIPLSVFQPKFRVLKKGQLKYGNQCISCQRQGKDFLKFRGQWFCYFCNYYLCEPCGDFYDPTLPGLTRFGHKHNLVYLINNSDEEFLNIDLHKLGNNQLENEINKGANIDELLSNKHFITCDLCSEQLEHHFRYICLNCSPGDNDDPDNFIKDFCEKCYMKCRGTLETTIFPKSDAPKHDLSTHNYFKIIVSFTEASYY